MKHETSFKNNSRVIWGLLAAMFFSLTGFVQPAFATHFRYGHLNWKQRPDISSTTVEFSLINAFRRDGYPGNGTDGLPVTGDIISETIGATELFFGDSASTGQLQYRVIAYDPTDNWIIGLALDPTTGNEKILHTYTAANDGGQPWIAAIDSCCRISTLANAPDGFYRVETLVDLTKTDHSPVSSLPPIVSCPQNSTCSFPIPSADSQPGVQLSWRLAAGAEDGGITHPPGLTINAATGAVTWDTTGAALDSLWATQAVIEKRDAATAAVLTKVAVDYIIRIVAPGDPPVIEPPPNTPPVCNTTVPAFVGNTVTFVVSASDPDPSDLVTLNSAGLPSVATTSPALPTSGNPVSVTFTWTPTAADVGSHVVNFTATDTGGLQANCPVTINVEQTSDTMPPTAQLEDPVNRALVARSMLNKRGYIDVTFSDADGSGLDITSVTDVGLEFTLGGAAASMVTVDGTPELVSGSTHRYKFSGKFGLGAVSVNFIGGAWSDQAGNLNLPHTENFTVTSTGPVVTGVDPDPVIGSSSPQMFTVKGSGFVAGAIVRLRDLTNGGVFDKATTSFDPTRLTINANFTILPATWTAQVVNPNAATSDQFSFRVIAPPSARTPTGWYYPLNYIVPDSANWLACDDHYVCGKCHLGSDLNDEGRLRMGTPVYTIGPGEVIGKQGPDQGWGKDNYALAILHNSKSGPFVAIYGHIRTSKKMGDKVLRGDVIGTIGPFPLGDHLHFGIHPGSGAPRVQSDLRNDPCQTSSCKSFGWGRMDSGCLITGFSNGFVDPIEWINTRIPAQ